MKPSVETKKRAVQPGKPSVEPTKSSVHPNGRLVERSNALVDTTFAKSGSNQRRARNFDDEILHFYSKCGSIETSSVAYFAFCVP